MADITRNIALLPQRQVSPGTFVGREAELSELAGEISLAEGGEARFLLISGEPGAGKTRLAAEAARRAEGTRCAWGCAWDDEGAPPLWPWIELVRNVMATVSPDDLPAMLSGPCTDLVAIVPEVRTILPEAAEPVALDPHGGQFRLFVALAHFLNLAAAEQPLLAILDDLHASDKASVRALQFVARTCRGARLCLLATAREAELGERLEADPSLRGVLRELSPVRLGGLSESALATLAEARLGFRVSGGFVGSLLRATSGNALFADELLRSLASRTDISPETKEIPARTVPLGVRAALRQRLDQLQPAARELLRVAALVGPEFDRRILSAAVDQTPDAIEPHLLRAQEWGLTERGDKRDRFVHDVTREALVEEVPPAETSRLHVSIAEAYRGLPNAEVAHLDDIAHHYTAAGGQGAPDLALDYARRAGADALGRMSPDRAVLWRERAMEMYSLLDDPSPSLRGELLLDLSEALDWQRSVDAARERLREAADLGRRSGDKHLLARAAIAFSGREPETGRVDRERIEVLEAALRAIEGEDAALESRVRTELASALYYTPDRHRIEPLTGAAVRLARTCDDPEVLCAAVQTRIFALWGPDHLDERRALADEGVAVAIHADLHRRILVLRTRRVMHALETGTVAVADAEIDAIRERASLAHDPRYAGYISVFAAMRASMEGRFDEAEARIGETFAAADKWAGESNLVQFAGVQLYALRREQGRLGELEPVVRGLVEQFPNLLVWRSVLAVLLIETGRPEEAASSLNLLARDDFGAITKDGQWTTTMALAADAVVAARDLEKCASLYECLAPYEHVVAIGGLGAVYYGSMARSLGVLAAAVGETETAIGHFERALAFEKKMGARPFIAELEARLGPLLEGRNAEGDRERASDLIDHAQMLAEEIGLVRVRALLDTGRKMRADRGPDVGGAASDIPTDPSPSAREGGVSTRPDLQPGGAEGARAAGAGSHAKEGFEASRGAPSPESPQRRFSFYRDGDGWRIGPGGREFRLKDSRGLDQLHRILSQSGGDLPATELVRAPGASPPGGISAGSHEDLAVGRGEQEDELLDPRAKEEYRARLADIETELVEAEDHNDLARIERLRVERDGISQAVAAATGLGGRTRRQAGGAERARINVTRTIRDAIKRIREHDEALGEHLRTHVRTGRLCGYSPDPVAPVEWELVGADRSS